MKEFLTTLVSSPSFYAAIASIGAAAFSYWKARSIYGYETKVRFKEAKLEKLSNLFKSEFVVNVSLDHAPTIDLINKLPKQKLAKLLEDRRNTQGKILRYFFRYQHLLSSTRRKQTYQAYQDTLDNHFQPFSSEENQFRWMSFVHILYTNVMQEMEEVAEELGNK